MSQVSPNERAQETPSQNLGELKLTEIAKKEFPLSIYIKNEIKKFSLGECCREVAVSEKDINNLTYKDWFFLRKTCEPLFIKKSHIVSVLEGTENCQYLLLKQTIQSHRRSAQVRVLVKAKENPSKFGMIEKFHKKSLSRLPRTIFWRI